MSIPNDQPLSVGQLSQAIKRSLEQNFDHVRVRGELSKVTLHRSGHLYTDLKDADAVINAVCWKTMVPHLGLKPEEGLEVICTGRLTTYGPQSRYQLIIERMELAGEGALLKMLAQRREKLAAEGLFDAVRKQALPFLPKRIGLITSPTGAVVRDIMHRLRDRFPLPVLLWPANMQGEQAAADVLRALQGFDALPAGHELRPDVIIIARGGGSVEDLLPFHDEALVRAVAACTIPVVSAVGHETDITLLDFVADMRAPTPTAAAEMVVKPRVDLAYWVTQQFEQLQKHMAQRLKAEQAEWRVLAQSLRDPARVLADKAQRLDMVGLKLGHMAKSLGQVSRQRFGLVAQRLQPPQKLAAIKRQQWQTAAGLLESYSFKNVLARGFALVTTPQGKLLPTAKAASAEPVWQVQFADGVMGVRKD